MPTTDRTQQQPLTGGPATHRRTCRDLGVCQMRTPPCRTEGCRPKHFIAPGVVEPPAPPRQHRQWWHSDWVPPTAILALAVCSYVAVTWWSRV